MRESDEEIFKRYLLKNGYDVESVINDNYFTCLIKDTMSYSFFVLSVRWSELKTELINAIKFKK